MAEIKFDELPEIFLLDDNDIIAVVDEDLDTSKFVTFANLINSITEIDCGSFI